MGNQLSPHIGKLISLFGKALLRERERESICRTAMRWRWELALGWILEGEEGKIEIKKMSAIFLKQDENISLLTNFTNGPVG